MLLLAAFVFIVFGLGTYAHSLYSSDINRLIAEHVTPNINKAGEHKAIIAPAVAIAVVAILRDLDDTVTTDRGAVRTAAPQGQGHGHK